MDFTGISAPGYEQMSRMVREVAKQLGGRGIMGYYGTCIQSYKHTLLSSSGPICMAVNSAAGLGIWVPADSRFPFALEAARIPGCLHHCLARLKLES